MLVGRCIDLASALPSSSTHDTSPASLPASAAAASATIAAAAAAVAATAVVAVAAVAVVAAAAAAAATTATSSPPVFSPWVPSLLPGEPSPYARPSSLAMLFLAAARLASDDCSRTLRITEGTNAAIRAQ